MSEVDAWVERLTDSRADVAWDELEAIGEDQRTSVVLALREVVLREVRSVPPQALITAERLVRAARGLDVAAGPAARAFAVALHANSRSDEARGHYERALEWYENRGEEVESARVRRSLVDVCQMTGDVDGALGHADAAREIFEMHDESTLLAQLECNVGNVYFRRDRFAEASRHYVEALRSFERAGDAFGRAYALHNLGNVRTNAHEFDAAIEDYTSARAAFVEGGHEVLAADCDYALGYLELRRGRFASAYVALTRARRRYAAGGKPSGAPLCDLDLAELHLRVDAFRDAMDRGEEAAKAFEKLDMRYEACKARLLVGLAQAQLGAVDGARRVLQASRDGFQQLGNPTLAALATLHLAGLVRGRIDALELLPEVERAASTLGEGGDALLGELATFALAEARLRAGSTEDAREALEEIAGRAGEEAGVPQIRIESLRLLAETDRAEGRRSSAEERLRKAVGWVEGALTRLTNADARLAFFSRRKSAFHELALLLLDKEDQGAVSEAIDLVERSRMHSLRERQPDIAASTQLRAARERVELMLARATEQRLEHGPDPTRAVALARETDALEMAQDRLLRIEREHRATWNDTLPQAAADAWVVGPGDRVLYFVGAHGRKRALLLEVGDAGELQVERSVDLGEVGPSVRRELERARFQVDKYRLGRDYLERHDAALRSSLERSFARLGERLLEPLQDCIDDRPLVIVPFGALHEVPFGALSLGGEPLVARTDVSVVRTLRRPAGDGPLANRRVLTCADAAGDLPAVGRELEAIRSTMLARVVSADGFRDALEGGADEALIHLAAHGNHQVDHPLFSGVRLGAKFLTGFDVARMRLPGRLVILSGCETGRQTLAAGEELYGPEQAFFRAGARGVISFLWPVADEMSATLISRVVEGLGDGLVARAAVSKAAREAWRSGCHPRDWAGLVYAGDPAVRLPDVPG